MQLCPTPDDLRCEERCGHDECERRDEGVAETVVLAEEPEHGRADGEGDVSECCDEGDPCNAVRARGAGCAERDRETERGPESPEDDGSATGDLTEEVERKWLVWKPSQ